MFGALGIKMSSKKDPKTIQQKRIEKLRFKEARDFQAPSEQGSWRGVKGGGKPPPWGQGVNKVMEEMKKWRSGYEWKREERFL